MTDLDLGADIEFNVKYGGKEYKLREPTVMEIETFKTEDEGGAKGAITALLEKLGMPQGVVETMPMSKVRKLIEGLIEGMTGKK